MKMPEEIESDVRRGDDSVGVEEIAQLLIVIRGGVDLLWVAFDEGLLILDRHRFKLIIIWILIKKDRRQSMLLEHVDAHRLHGFVVVILAGCVALMLLDVGVGQGLKRKVNQLPVWVVL